MVSRPAAVRLALVVALLPTLAAPAVAQDLLRPIFS